MSFQWTRPSIRWTTSDGVQFRSVSHLPKLTWKKAWASALSACLSSVRSVARSGIHLRGALRHCSWWRTTKARSRMRRNLWMRGSICSTSTTAQRLALIVSLPSKRLKVATKWPVSSAIQSSAGSARQYFRGQIHMTTLMTIQLAGLSVTKLRRSWSKKF